MAAMQIQADVVYIGGGAANALYETHNRLNRPETTTMHKVTTSQTMETHGAMGLPCGNRGASR